MRFSNPHNFTASTMSHFPKLSIHLLHSARMCAPKGMLAQVAFTQRIGTVNVKSSNLIKILAKYILNNV